MRKISIVVLIFLLSLHAVFAGELGLGMTTISDPTLAHGTTTYISTYVSNENDFCDLNCEYELVNLDSMQTEKTDYFVNSAGSSYPLSVPVTAPSKQNSPEIEGNIPYTLLVMCQEEEIFMVCSSDVEPTQEGFTLHYELSSTEKQAYDSVDSRLKSVKPLMEDLEDKEYYVRTKIDNLPRNMLKDDFLKTLGRISDSVKSDLNNYDSAVGLFDDREFVTADRMLQSSIENSVILTMDSLDQMDINIENRIKTHNKIAEDINTLAIALEEVSADAQRAGFEDESSLVQAHADSTSDMFEQGTYSSYTDLQQDVLQLSYEIEELRSTVYEAAEQLMDELWGIIQEEMDKLCSISSVCWTDEFLNSFRSKKELEHGCSLLAGEVVDAFILVNDELFATYLDEKDVVDEKNREREEHNALLEKVNTVVVLVEEKLNTEGTNIPSEECSNKIGTLNTQISEGVLPGKELIETVIQECTTLSDTVIAEAEAEKGFFAKIGLFFKKIVRKVNKVELASAELLTLEELPQEPILHEITEETKAFITDVCDKEIKEYKQDRVTKIRGVEGKQLSQTSVKDTKEFEEQCCVFGSCQPCCTGDVCKTKTELYPVVFLHGHSFDSSDSPYYSLSTFDLYQFALIGAEYLPGKTLLPSMNKVSYEEGDWDVGRPYSVTTTYYFDVYNSNGDLVGTPSKLESISTYADRFGNVVDVLKHRTNKDKVNIVAHSMGGLVAREYIRNNPNSVHKLILLGTPNHGYPREGGEGVCKSGPLYKLGGGGYVTGEPNECDDMHPDSSFLSRLNQDETPGSTSYYTIAGKTEIGDCWKNWGIAGDDDCTIQVDSVRLSGATNVVIRAEHNELVESEEALNHILEFLTE